MIRIRYNNHTGILNINTEQVYFYHFKYANILEAIQKVEHDIKANEEEIKIFDELLDNLLITST